jgi:cytochrome c oxidase cbb3-type subunit III
MRPAHRVFIGMGAIAIALVLTSCEREYRQFRAVPPAAEEVRTIRMGELQVGSAAPAPAMKNPYDDNAYAISEGKRLYVWFNCVGCHFHGGGGIGPALMDDA